MCQQNIDMHVCLFVCFVVVSCVMQACISMLTAGRKMKRNNLRFVAMFTARKDYQHGICLSVVCFFVFFGGLFFRDFTMCREQIQCLSQTELLGQNYRMPH